MLVDRMQDQKNVEYVRVRRKVGFGRKICLFLHSDRSPGVLGSLCCLKRTKRDHHLESRLLCASPKVEGNFDLD